MVAEPHPPTPPYYNKFSSEKQNGGQWNVNYTEQSGHVFRKQCYFLAAEAWLAGKTTVAPSQAHGYLIRKFDH